MKTWESQQQVLGLHQAMLGMFPIALGEGWIDGFPGLSENGVPRNSIGFSPFSFLRFLSGHFWVSLLSDTSVLMLEEVQ